MINFYDSTNSGSYFIGEQISKIEKQITKDDPVNLVETALHDARNLLWKTKLGRLLNKISTVHLGISITIHDCKWIAGS